MINKLYKKINLFCDVTTSTYVNLCEKKKHFPWISLWILSKFPFFLMRQYLLVLNRLMYIRKINCIITITTQLRCKIVLPILCISRGTTLPSMHCGINKPCEILLCQSLQDFPGLFSDFCGLKWLILLWLFSKFAVIFAAFLIVLQWKYTMDSVGKVTLEM